MPDLLLDIHLKDQADIAVVGLGFLGLFYLAALQLELQLTAWIFQAFLVVVFQDDLRRLFERSRSKPLSPATARGHRV